MAKPSAKLLDGWLGEESIQYFKEKSLKQLIRRHIEESHEIDLVEGIGAINFLSIDDLLVGEEGGPLHPESIISLPVKSGKPVYPLIKKSIDDSFLLILNKSKQKWVVILDERQKPAFVVDADGFIRGALFDTATFNPDEYTHRPIVVSNSSIPLGEVLKRFETKTADHEDDVITNDVIVVWGKKKQIITGADILGRLMRGIIKGHDPDHLDRSTA